MHYDQLVTILVNARETLALRISEQVVKQQIPSGPTTIEEYLPEARLILLTLEGCVVTGDPTAWRNLATEFAPNNGSTAIFETYSSIFSTQIKNIIVEALPKPENERIRASYLRRIDSLQMVGNVAAINQSILRKEG